MDDLFSQIKRFVEPESVAMIGVSSRTGPGSFNGMEYLIERGYKGRIYAVNPRGGEILGIKVYPTVTDIPEVVDLAVISTPRTAVPGIVRECVAKGIKAVAVITQGFADADDEGKKMQSEIVESIRGTGTRIVGPNTLGMVNAFENFYPSFVNYTNRVAANGVVCQSGVFLAGALDFSAGVGIGIDIGNTADIDFADCLAYFEMENRVRVVNLHMEGLHEGRRFMEAARRVSRLKPVLCLKTGRSEEGARAASSHSGSLAGEDAVYDAAFRQASVIRVNDVGEMNCLNKTFMTYTSIPGKRVAIVTISGGAGIAMVDACSQYGLDVADFSKETLEALAEVYPKWMEVGNPADIWPAGMSKGYLPVTRMALEKIMDDPQVDAVICITPAYKDPDRDPLDITWLFKDIAGKYPDKPLAAWIFGPHRRQYAQKLEEEGTIVVYPSPERAARALAALYNYHHRIKNAPAVVEDHLPGFESSKIEALIIEERKKGSEILGADALEIIRSCGIPSVRSVIASSRVEAEEAALKIGLPVVMKLNSPDVSHKSDIGGVRVGLKTAEEVAEAFDQIMKNAAEKAPGARLEGVLLQEYRTKGTEVIIGARRDEQFGPVVVYGLGGIYTEIFRDVSFRVAPVGTMEAKSMIAETKSYKILRGARGHAPADISALAGAITRLSRLVSDFPGIIELDINPLLAGPEGVVALDARIALSGE
ncbi:MAG: acetate--CoA ligase family protein [Bacillota bacterium]